MAELEGGDLNLGQIPNRVLDQFWGRNSFSSWTTKYNKKSNAYELSPVSLEEGVDRDEQDREIKLEDLSPLDLKTKIETIQNLFFLPMDH